jgi:hypothetical protein
MVLLNQQWQPTLFMEIKDDSWGTGAEKHCQADKQMHRQFMQMVPSFPLAHLYGLTFLGTSLHIYCANTATGHITPDAVRCPHLLWKIKPASTRKCDISLPPTHSLIT